ncbi:hypothetical protein HPB50_006199 [Hyalomma asiaticum]|uniref:Uncharacterized protein n=1 Tax=Hyalomma asiaticum TaxID=266040 RepID=A0ACB7RX86_HYAAI|nr:hypothetical protein HPB50_006199 [Hyalomma asiaticum]
MVSSVSAAEQRPRRFGASAKASRWLVLHCELCHASRKDMANVHVTYLLAAFCVLSLLGCLRILPGYVHVRVSWPEFHDIVEVEAEEAIPFGDVALVRPPVSEKMTLAFIICEDHFDLGIVAVKSAVAYSTTRLHLIMIADDKNEKRAWTESMFPNEDAVLVADTDVVFIHPVEDLWRKFYAMNEWQMVGMAPATEDYGKNYYLKKGLHPFPPPFGLNAGVLLMNLTRMRAFDLDSRITKLRDEFEGRVPWGDQDLLNILYARHPQGLFTFTCRWNYRGDHCYGDGPLHRRPHFGGACVAQVDPEQDRTHASRKDMANVHLMRLLVALCVLSLLGCLRIRPGYVHVRVSWPEFHDIVEVEAEQAIPFSDVALVRPPVREKMTLAYVICGGHFDLGIVAVKSAVAYSTTRLHLIIIADDKNQKRMWTEHASRKDMANVHLMRLLVALCVLSLLGCLRIRPGYVHVRVSWPQFLDIVEVEAEESIPFRDVALVRPPVREKMNLAYVICGGHFDLGIVAVKSAVAYSTTRLHLIIIADDKNQKRMWTEIFAALWSTILNGAVGEETSFLRMPVSSPTSAVAWATSAYGGSFALPVIVHGGFSEDGDADSDGRPINYERNEPRDKGQGT